jgi:hypothetical protein
MRAFDFLQLVLMVRGSFVNSGKILPDALGAVGIITIHHHHFRA